ncbi:hypothetical protein ATANTOWER_008782 [Ataeniobius toweri]|uniref:Uncharacterized protein n=1 Tax=Ataeniobius toweri TaxID=208326 RepID=A0ABU7BS73_9TELE|nr:hypothetical protein [Ataeniobius toweri]
MTQSTGRHDKAWFASFRVWSPCSGCGTLPGVILTPGGSQSQLTTPGKLFYCNYNKFANYHYAPKLQRKNVALFSELMIQGDRWREVIEVIENKGWADFLGVEIDSLRYYIPIMSPIMFTQPLLLPGNQLHPFNMLSECFLLATCDVMTHPANSF